jgi:hypothetical protein
MGREMGVVMVVRAVVGKTGEGGESTEVQW